MNIKVLITFVALLVLAGCGVREASIESGLFRADEAAVFTPSSEVPLNFTSNTFFLWKDGFTGHDVLAVSMCSKNLDDVAIVGLELQEKEKQTVQPLRDEQRALTREYNKILKGLPKEQGDEIKAQQKLLDEANTAVEQSPDDEALKLKVAEEGAKLIAVREKYSPKLNELAKRIDELTPLIAQAETAINSEKELNDKKLVDNAKKIRTIVEWYDSQPSRINVDFAKDPQHPEVKIEGWDPNDGCGKRTFTSELVPTEVTKQLATADSARAAMAVLSKSAEQGPSVQAKSEEETTKLYQIMAAHHMRPCESTERDAFDRVATVDGDVVEYGSILSTSYSPKAGRVQFNLKGYDGYKFDFNFSRVSYNDPSGRTQMSGDITRRKSGQATRYGVVKLSDSGN